MFVLLKVQSLQLSFRPAGVSLGGGGGGPRPPSAPLATPLYIFRERERERDVKTRHDVREPFIVLQRFTVIQVQKRPIFDT